jgi:hypothetical protein
VSALERWKHDAGTAGWAETAIDCKTLSPKVLRYVTDTRDLSDDVAGVDSETMEWTVGVSSGNRWRSLNYARPLTWVIWPASVLTFVFDQRFQPAKEATLPLPASGHAANGTPCHEKITSDNATQTQKAA